MSELQESKIYVESFSGHYGEDITFLITNYDTENMYQHNLRCRLDSGKSFDIVKDFSIVISETAEIRYTFTVPNDWMNYIPDRVVNNLTFTLETWNITKIGGTGGTEERNIFVGDSSVHTTVYVPSSVVPSITNIACSDPNGYATTYGGYVQRKSKVTVTATASGTYSSSIISYKITANEQNFNDNGCTTYPLITSGTNTITVKVTDSRYRTKTVTTTINVLPYASPTITTLSAYRCNSNGAANEEGAYMRISYKASISALNNKNGKTFKLQYKKQSDSSYSTHTTYSSAYTWEGYAIIAADVNAAYDVLLTAQDDFTTSNYQIVVSTAFTLIDFNKSGHGIAFGKASEKDAFECNLPLIGKSIKTEAGADLDSANTKASKGYDLQQSYANSESCTLFGGASGTDIGNILDMFLDSITELSTKMICQNLFLENNSIDYNYSINAAEYVIRQVESKNLYGYFSGCLAVRGAWSCFRGYHTSNDFNSDYAWIEFNIYGSGVSWKYSNYGGKMQSN